MFHISALTDVIPGHWGGQQVAWPWNRWVKSCFIIICQLLTPFTSGPWLQKWAGFTSVPSPMWNPDTGVDTKCQTMEPMCQIMFYNQLPTSYTIHKWILAPEVGRFHIGAITNVIPEDWGGHRKWNRCVKSCFIINCQLLTPFTSGPWLQKWVGSTSVPSLIWNLDNGADTTLLGHGTDVSNHVL